MSMYVHPSKDFEAPILNRGFRNNEFVIENLAGLDYVRRRAIPTIRHYVIIPFEEGLVENARREAREEEKIGLEGILSESYTVRHNPDTKIMIDTTIFPDIIVEYKKALDEFTSYLNSILFERGFGIRRDKIRSRGNEIYIEVSHAEKMMKHIHDKHSRQEESKLITIRDSETEKKIELGERQHINITLDKEHNKSLSSDNLIQYYNSLEMINSLRAFMIDFKKYYMGRNNVNPDNLDSKVQRDYPLAKGGIIRMLFYPQREIDYRKIYHDIAGNPRKTLVPDTGDIDILASIPPAMENYYHEKDKSKLRVELNNTKVRIIRERKSHGPQAQTYHVLFHDNKIYVSIRDMLNRMEESKKANTEKIIRLKVDPIMPEPQF